MEIGGMAYGRWFARSLRSRDGFLPDFGHTGLGEEELME
jgi:hypothetical protein